MTLTSHILPVGSFSIPAPKISSTRTIESFITHYNSVRPIPTMDLINSNDSNIVLKQKIKYFNDSEIPLLACNYCGGRDYSSEHVEPAVQIKKPLSYVKQEEYN